MSTPVPNVPVVNEGNLYVNGLTVTAGALNADLLSTATLTIGVGSARDSLDINDINLTAPATLSLAATAVGSVNGLDRGALAATTLYAVYVIGDSKKYSPTGSLLSLSTNAAPFLPVGYDMYRRIGTVITNAAATRILNFHQRGKGQIRNTYYAVPFDTLVVAGASAVFAPVTLTTWVPSTASRVYIKSVLTSDAGATRTVVYSADAGTTIAASADAGEVIMSSPASEVTSLSLTVPVTTAAGVQTIQYAVSDAAAAVAVDVQGFEEQL